MACRRDPATQQMAPGLVVFSLATCLGASCPPLFPIALFEHGGRLWIWILVVIKPVFRWIGEYAGARLDLFCLGVVLLCPQSRIYTYKVFRASSDVCGLGGYSDNVKQLGMSQFRDATIGNEHY